MQYDSVCVSVCVLGVLILISKGLSRELVGMRSFWHLSY